MALRRNNKKLRTRKSTRQATRSDSGLEFENLEDRQLLAFDFLFDGTTLTLSQVSDDGIVTIDNAAGGDAFRVADGAGLITYEAATNVVIDLMDTTNHLSLALENAHAGDVEILAGNGDRSILFVGSGNQIDGDLTISAGDGNQLVSPSHTTQLVVGGSIDINTGTTADLDELNFINSFSAGGDVDISGPRYVDVQDAMNVGGNLTVDSSEKLGLHRFEKTAAVPSSIGGDFTYIGSTWVDTIDLANIDIQGDMIVNLDSGFLIGVSNQLFALDNVSFNNLMLESGIATNADEVIWSSVVAEGDISIDLGEGDNTAVLNGVINGDIVSYSGLSGVDHVSYSMAGGAGQQVNATLGEGIDTFSLFDGSTISELNVDFGGVEDHFVNVYGDFTFDANLTSLDFFDHKYDLATDTLSMTEIPNVLVGGVSVLSDPLTHQFQVTGDVLTSADTLNIQMLGNSLRELELFFQHEIGTFDLDLGAGNRIVEFNGPVNTFDQLSISAIAGLQSIAIDNGSDLFVHGDASIDLGRAPDTILTTPNDIEVGGNLDLIGVNDFENNGLLWVGGNLTLDLSSQTDEHSEFTNLEEMRVLGDMSVFGGGGYDGIGLDGAISTEIDGNLFVDLSGNINPAPQGILLSSTATVGGDFTVLSTDDQMSDIVGTENGTLVSGDTIIDLGDGTNNAILRHENGGDLIRYIGGQGQDGVLLETYGAAATLNISLGDHDDFLELGPAVSVGEFLRVDFGRGNDIFINSYGDFDFDARLLNLAGINAFYYHATSELNLVQVEDLGPIAVGNHGPGMAIQIDSLGPSYSVTPSDNLRVTLMSDSDLEMDVVLDSPLAGDLTLNLQHGNREISFLGTSNVIQGDMRIVSGDGDQNIRMGSVSDLVVEGDAVINLRDGVDSILDEGLEIQVGGNMILRNVDHYEVTNKLQVDGNMTMAAHWYTQDTRFDNDGTIEIAGRFTYLGSDGRDDVLLSGNVTIGDEIYIGLGDNVNIGPGQTVAMSNGFAAADRLTIQGGTSIGGNNVLTDDTTTIDGDFIVDFTGSTTSNTAVLKGQYGGGYGTFRGGEANDILLFDAVAEDMGWASLTHGGDDEVALGANTELLLKYLDLGFGNDVLEDDHIADFPMTVLNLP